ncbi:calcium-transporting atpase [Moniliophthora roreri MCA 2997]|uniref:Calcium-transporting ATPase n=1 Tax=Moniliophthora roreri (strain MCA 2997) TaxID=1381753 RepID=V2WY83_MONRO|nr:calcium-transporting atpase [Moniliophthora roreri MCA 2997]
MSPSSPNIIIQTPEIDAPDDKDQSSQPPFAPNSSPDANLLSPTSANPPRISLDTSPGSPTTTAVDSNDASSFVTIPPSPTLSNKSSVHFDHKSTLALRNNKPDSHSGMGSLALLSPSDGQHGHRRKGSNATFMSAEGTEPDSHNTARNSPGMELSPVKTNTTEATRVPSRDTQRISQKGVGGGASHGGDHKGEDSDDEDKHKIPELDQDVHLDPSPFRFKPYELAHMFDPKSYETLESFGGVQGVLRGLGADPVRGLNPDDVKHPPTRSQTLDGHSGGVDGPGAGLGASQRHDPNLPEITLTEPGGGHGKATSASDLNAAAGGGASGGGGGNDEWDNSGALNASLADRRRVYGENALPIRKAKSLFALMAAAMKDKVLILLSIAAAVSLALGLFQDFGTKRESDEPPVDWVEGVAIIIAIIVVVLVGSINDWQKEKQVQALNSKKDERGVKIIRGGQEKEVVVGDVALLEPGEIVPCDGIFLSGHNVKCDESAATGESDAIKKVTWAEWTALRQKEKDGGAHVAHTDCFVLSGSKVQEGMGRYVVVAVGTKSFNGRIMMALRGDAEATLLQLKLNDLAELIAKLGSGAGLILFVALFIRFLARLPNDDRTPNEKGITFVNILVISVSLIVASVPEGLPLAVTLSLALATKRMTYENLLVRVLGSCEQMANASVICTDKTGTLTVNDMTVVAGSVGIHAKFVRGLEENSGRTNAGDRKSSDGQEETAARKHKDDFSIDQSNLNSILSPQLRNLINENIAVNSTAFEDTDPSSGETILVGSKTETALIKLTKELGWPAFQEVREIVGATDRVVSMFPFSSERKAMGVVVKMDNGLYRLHAKGASEILSKKCSRHVVVGRPGQEAPSDGDIETKEIDELASDNISRTIIFYANQTLRTIALCYRDFNQWPPTGAPLNGDEVPWEYLADDMTLIAITGLEDPLRPGVRDAVAKCHRAGVTVKMCTGDNVLTARSIAAQCGIFTPGGIIMEGPVFRKLSQSDMIEIVPRLQVLARSSPEDKKTLVETLKHIGEVVGVTGDGTNDGPALKTAHVGFSMGIAGTEVAKEASDIILMDDNFASIVKAIIWGRAVNDSVRKFLQFQIATNICAVVITFVSAVASGEEESVLSAVQLLWVNIIMDTFAALALATDPGTEKHLDRKPEKQSAPLFTVPMFKQIIIQAIYQITVLLIFHFLGLRILSLADEEHNRKIVKTLVFNAFVFAQIFNSVNSRRLDSQLNIFEGMHRNLYFVVITLLEIAIQVLIVFVGGAAFQVVRVAGREWGISLALGFVAIPLGAVIRLLPDGPFERAFKKIGLMGRRKVLPTSSADQEEGWIGAVSLVRDNLRTFTTLRGGRLRANSFVVKSRSAKMNDVEPIGVSSLLTMAPTLMAGAIATRGYAQGGNLSDPTSTDPSKSSAALWEGKLQIHPDTPHDDPAYKKFGGDHNII